MPINYEIEPELNLLYTLFYGTVAKEDAFNYAVRLNRDPLIKNAVKTLVVLKESRLIFNIEDVETFSRKMAKNKSIKFRDKVAILIESPTDTVAATIYAQTLLTMRKEVSVELFYTLDAALQFLELTNQKENVNNMMAKEPQEADFLRNP